MTRIVHKNKLFTLHICISWPVSINYITHPRQSRMCLNRGARTSNSDRATPHQITCECRTVTTWLGTRIAINIIHYYMYV